MSSGVHIYDDQQGRYIFNIDEPNDRHSLGTHNFSVEQNSGLECRLYNDQSVGAQPYKRWHVSHRIHPSSEDGGNTGSEGINSK